LTPLFEILLPLVALACYLFDSSLLLYSNELVYGRHRDEWRHDVASPVVLFGRQLWLPNPLFPERPSFRIHWTATDARPEGEDLEALGVFLRALRPLALPIQGMLWLLIGLPIELWCFGAGLGLLALFATFYLLIGLSLGYIYYQRRSLGLSRRGFLSLSLDVLACAPFAINLVRKLCLRRSLAGNPILFARRAFSATAFALLINELCSQLEREKHLEEAGTPRWTELEQQGRELRRLLPC
jgi:hypothetical protein